MNRLTSQNRGISRDLVSVHTWLALSRRTKVGHVKILGEVTIEEFILASSSCITKSRVSVTKVKIRMVVGCTAGLEATRSA